MSKSNSGHFSGTTGHYKSISKQLHKGDIISDRVVGLDTRQHPITYTQISPKQNKEISNKIANRSATKEEYKHKEWNKRFNRRRKDGVNMFWDQEKQRLLLGLPGTRQWTAAQRRDILNDIRPKHRGKTIQAHHTYSARLYPHLANKGEIIYPVTQNEHLYGWHGGNYKDSLPGKPIKRIHDF